MQYRRGRVRNVEKVFGDQVSRGRGENLAQSNGSFAEDADQSLGFTFIMEIVLSNATQSGDAKPEPAPVMIGVRATVKL